MPDFNDNEGSRQPRKKRWSWMRSGNERQDLFRPEARKLVKRQAPRVGDSTSQAGDTTLYAHVPSASRDQGAVGATSSAAGRRAKPGNSRLSLDNSRPRLFSTHVLDKLLALRYKTAVQQRREAYERWIDLRHRAVANDPDHVLASECSEAQEQLQQLDRAIIAKGGPPFSFP